LTSQSTAATETDLSQNSEAIAPSRRITLASKHSVFQLLFAVFVCEVGLRQGFFPVYIFFFK